MLTSWRVHLVQNSEILNLIRWFSLAYKKTINEKMFGRTNWWMQIALIPAKLYIRSKKSKLILCIRDGYSVFLTLDKSVTPRSMVTQFLLSAFKCTTDSSTFLRAIMSNAYTHTYIFSWKKSEEWKSFLMKLSWKKEN